MILKSTKTDDVHLYIFDEYTGNFKYTAKYLKKKNKHF